MIIKSRNILLNLLYVVIIILIYIKYVTNSNPFCVSLIIPSTYQDLVRCSTTLKNSICNSMKYPDEIVLVVSGIGDSNLYNFSKIIEDIRKCTKKLIIYSRKGKKNCFIK